MNEKIYQMLPSHKDGVFALRDEGKSYRQISKEVKERMGVDLSARQVGSILHHDYDRKTYEARLEDQELWPAVRDTVSTTYLLDPTYTTEQMIQLIQELYGEKV